MLINVILPMDSPQKFPRKVISGVQPTGVLHLGNYFGAIKPWIHLQNTENDVSYFIADLHSMTLPYVCVFEASIVLLLIDNNNNFAFVFFFSFQRIRMSCVRIFCNKWQHCWHAASIRPKRIYLPNRPYRNIRNCVGYSHV